MYLPLRRARVHFREGASNIAEMPFALSEGVTYFFTNGEKWREVLKAILVPPLLLLRTLVIEHYEVSDPLTNDIISYL